MFYDRFVNLCESKGVSLSKAATEAGISKSLVTKWKNNSIKLPSPDVLDKLSNYFGISVAELISENGQNNKPTPVSGDELSDAEHEFIKLFRLVPEQDRDLVVEMVRAALRSKGLL